MPAHQEYRELWKKAGYSTGVASAIACRPPADQSFRRVYYLTSTDHAINNIALGRIKVSRFSSLNDPFELLALQLNTDGRKRRFHEFKQEYEENKGLLCFSADWADPVLWSHYAEKHHGICLGFDVPRNYIRKVGYKKERIITELSSDQKGFPEITEKVKESLLYTKFESWKYEKEYRRLIPLSEALSEDGHHFFSFGETLRLAEVILGALCGADIAKVRELTDSKYQGVVTYKARLAVESFNIVPDEKTIP